MEWFGKKEGKDEEAADVPAPASAPAVMTKVEHLPEELLGELVAATLDMMTQKNPAIPTTPKIIETAQKTLTAMGIEGDLMTRSKEIDAIIDNMCAHHASDCQPCSCDPPCSVAAPEPPRCRRGPTCATLRWQARRRRLSLAMV